VKNLAFQELDYSETFAGIWACASLLHCPKAEMSAVMQRMTEALKPICCSKRLHPITPGVLAIRLSQLKGKMSLATTSIYCEPFENWGLAIMS
jgi:hypothetical protein